MVRKMQGLAYPSNPMAAIRELQELNAVEPTPPPSPDPPTKPEEPIVALQVVGVDSSEVASADSNEEALAESSERSSAKGSRRRSATGSERASKVASATSSATVTDPDNPMHSAVVAMLGRPFSPELEKGPFTVTTVKIPTEIWERLSWLSSLTGQPKQEVIADALKEHFKRAVKEL
jgi:hypothetical protein